MFSLVLLYDLGAQLAIIGDGGAAGGGERASANDRRSAGSEKAELEGLIGKMMQMFVDNFEDMNDDIRHNNRLHDCRIPTSNPDGLLAELLFMVGLSANSYNAAKRGEKRNFVFCASPTSREALKEDLEIVVVDEEAAGGKKRFCPVQLTTITPRYTRNGKMMMRKMYQWKEKAAWKNGVPLVLIDVYTQIWEDIKLGNCADNNYLVEKFLVQLQKQMKGKRTPKKVRRNIARVMGK